MPSRHHEHHEHASPEPDEVEFESYLHMERTLRHIRRLAGTRDFPDAESAAAYLSTLSEKDLKKAARDLSQDPKGMAQEFAYEAMDTEDDEEALEFARKALELDPECVDALHVLAECTAESPEELIALVGKAVDAGARNAKQSRTQPQNRFWDVVELSPYMRALHHQADLLRVAGRTGEAVERLETMLRLDPDDNHGGRDLLLGCYLVQRDLPRTRALIERFAEDRSAAILWSAALERFLAQDTEGAASALHEAREQNPHVEPYLALREIPEEVPEEEYEPGDEMEALHCLYAVGPAWLQYPEAIAWLEAAAQ